MAASTDTMTVLPRRLDPMARDTRRFLEDEVDAPTTGAMEKTPAVACELRGGPGSHAGPPGAVGGPAPWLFSQDKREPSGAAAPVAIGCHAAVAREFWRADDAPAP